MNESTKDQEIKRLEQEKEQILQQARCWAFEAKTQRSTVNQVGALLGGVPDWGAIVKGVRDRIEKSESQSSLLKEMGEALELINRTSEDKGREGCTFGDTEFDSMSAAHGYNVCLNYIKDDIQKALETYNKLKE
jgi:hypothetical protein